MKGGDISNQFAPAIAIDVDDLIIKITKPKTIVGIPLGRTLIEIQPGVSTLLHRFFSTEVSIYLICIREDKNKALEIQEFLDEHYLPYSRFYKITTSLKLHDILNEPHLTAYYYRDMTHKPPLGTVNKAVRVESILEGI